ncbi:MAG: sterol desaturase family protein [Bacteroidota bacterium]
MGGLQYAAFIFPVLLLLVLLEYLVSRRQGKETYAFSDTIVNMCCGMLERSFDFFYVVMMYFIFDFLYESVALWHIPSSPLVWIGALLFADFLAYWHHRLSHEINFFWAAHIVHHSSEELNITTVFRVSAFAVINRSLFFIWMPILGFDPTVTTSAIVFIGLYQFVTHTRLVGKLGILEYFMVTPSHHRVHHARNEKYLDKNYGHVFIIWDKLLGTFAPEEEEPDYGITTGLDSANPYWTYLHYWADLIKRARAASNWKDKIRIFLMPPTWTPEGVPFSSPEFKVNDKGERVKYFLNVPFRLQLYVLFNVIVTLALFISAFMIKNQLESPSVFELLTQSSVIQIFFMVVASIFSFGLLMEQKSWALKYEYFRLAFMAINIPILFSGTPYDIWISTVSILIIGIFAVWAIRMRNYFEKKPMDGKVPNDAQRMPSNASVSASTPKMPIV